MSGAVAAHAAYNGSGTQGLAVTNKISEDDGDVRSVFWNENDTTRQLLYGSSVIEIPSSGSSTLSYGSSRLFTINNDIDCLGEMYIQLKASFPDYTPTTNLSTAAAESVAAESVAAVGVGADSSAKSAAAAAESVAASLSGAWDIKAKPFSLQTVISRVEIQVGTQIWQTIEYEDLRVINATELPVDAFSEVSHLTTPTTDGVTAQTAWLVLPSLASTLGPRFAKFTNQSEDGYLMAAAPHQSVKVKVYFRDGFSSTLTCAGGLSSTAAAKLANGVNFATTKVEVEVPLQENGNTFVGTLTYAAGTADGSTADTINTALAKGTLVANIDSAAPGKIESCTLFAKQQIMCNEEREQMKAMPTGIPKRVRMTQNAVSSDIGNTLIKTIDLDHFSLYASHLIISGNAGDNIRLKSAELKLNSSSYSGQLPGVLLDACTADSIGIYNNKYIRGASSFNVEEFGIGTYVFPLASTVFGGSSVPLNRFDSIRLTLQFTSTFVPGPSTFINVTCVGETTALYKGGAASLAMY